MISLNQKWSKYLYKPEPNTKWKALFVDNVEMSIQNNLHADGMRLYIPTHCLCRSITRVIPRPNSHIKISMRSPAHKIMHAIFIDRTRFTAFTIRYCTSRLVTMSHDIELLLSFCFLCKWANRYIFNSKFQRLPWNILFRFSIYACKICNVHAFIAFKRLK